MRKPRTVLLRLLLLLPLFVLLSCSAAGASLSVLRANFLLRNGRDALATYRFLETKKGRAAQRWEDWISYDLGTLYISLGELAAGLRQLDSVLEGYQQPPGPANRRDRELFFRTFFNLGVGHYEKGEFAGATASFIEALRLKPGSWDAKINLELSLEALERSETNGSAAIRRQEVQAGPETERNQDEEREFFEAVRREEKPAWSSAPLADTYEKDW